jgi:hypothetical protein
MVARLESSEEFKCVLEKMQTLEYDVISNDDMVAFIYKKDANNTRLRGDLISCKTVCKFHGSIKVIHGTSSASM